MPDCKRWTSAVLTLIAQAVFILLFNPACLRAQYIKQLNARQFLNASEVYHVVRDHTGFLWFCTNHGLVKYDGNTCQYYTIEKGLADNMVFNVYEDSRGRIWPFCYNGKYCYLEGDSIHNESNDRFLSNLPHTDSYVTCMAESEDHGLYMGFLSRSILYLSQSGVLWKAEHKSQGGLVISRNKIEYSTSPTPGINVISADNKYQLTADNTGIQITIDGGPTRNLGDPMLTSKSVTDLCLSQNRELFVSTIHGLIIINLSTGAKHYLLRGTRVTGCTTDVAGNFWITTVNNGIYLLQQELFGIHYLPGGDNISLTHINDGKIVFIKATTLFELKKTTSGLSALKIDSGISNYYNPLLVTDQLAAFYDTWKAEIHVETKKSTIASRDPVFFRKMYAYGDHQYLGCGKTSTSYYQLTNGKFKADITNKYPFKITSSCQNSVTGDVFFAGGGSIFKCNFQTAKDELICRSPLLNDVTAMSAQDGRLLVATGAKRYLVVSIENAKIDSIKTAFHVSGITTLSPGKLILSSDGADYLCRPYNKAYVSEKIQYPFSSSIYEHIAFIGNQCLVQVDAKCYYFDTSLLNKHVSPPAVYLKRLVINGERYATPDVEIRNTTKVDILASVGMLDFGNNAQTIKYRLAAQGNGDWYVTSPGDISFVLRKPGQYQIEIAPNNIATAGAPFVIKVNVRTPFLQSTVFYALCITLAVLLTIAIAIVINRKRKQHFSRELNYLKMEHNAINALLNPHFIFNSINNIQGLIHKLRTHEAVEYLATLSRLIRQNLENLQFNLISLENELEVIKRYVDLQNLRFQDNLKVSIEVDEDLLDVHIPPLLIHTFVENAIVHGYRDRDKPFVVEISILRQGEYLKITISDNGIGFNAAKENRSFHKNTSMGISFSEKRLKRISDFYHLEQSIFLKDLSEENKQGSEVVITIHGYLKEIFEQRHLSVH